jgi:hypothetical protein
MSLSLVQSFAAAGAAGVALGLSAGALLLVGLAALPLIAVLRGLAALKAGVRLLLATAIPWSLVLPATSSARSDMRLLVVPFDGLSPAQLDAMRLGVEASVLVFPLTAGVASLLSGLAGFLLLGIGLAGLPRFDTRPAGLTLRW